MVTESNITVLIIDDDHLACQSISDYLAACGFVPLRAENGRKGLEIFRQEHPDVILVDLCMPEVDGLEVLSAVTQASPEIPVIMISGTGVLQDAIETLRSGAWDYIPKPIADMAVLKHAVCKAIEKAELLRENRRYRENLEEEIGTRTSELEARTEELEIANERLRKEIADHRHTSAQLRQAQKMEAIGTLASGIAHDFNNILFPIFGYAQMILTDLPEGENRNSLENILKAARRAKDLVRQILTFTRQTEREQKHLLIQPILKEALKLLRATLPATIEICADISETCVPILADPTQIHQVMMNLCTNAYHAMREKGGRLGVTLEGVELDPDDAKRYLDICPGPYFRLTVSDTGHGMTDEVMERVFDPYFTTKTIGEGTGLGLSVVRGIVKTHNGHVTVCSEPGKGTTFHVYLPLAATEKVSPIPEASVSSMGTERILLVDDEEEIVRMEKQMLERLGYHVTSRTVSTEVLEMFREDPLRFDLVITDVTMPVMTGLDLSKELIRIRPDIPIILCTGFIDPGTEEKAKAAGIREYVMKPLLRNEISSLIRRVLDKA